MVTILVAMGSTTLVSAEQLDLLTRFGRQLKDDHNSGGITLGLVGALQKWANTLEAQTSTILAEVSELKTANAKLTAEVDEVKLQNMNLISEIQAANERSAVSLKEASARSDEAMKSVKAEMAGLRGQLEDQALVLGQQASQIAAADQLAADQATQLTGVTSQLEAVQGKNDKFQEEAMAVMTARVEAMHSNVTSTLHDFSHDLELTKEETSTSLAALGERLGGLEAVQITEVDQLRSELGNSSASLEKRLVALDGQVKRELTGSLKVSF